MRKRFPIVFGVVLVISIGTFAWLALRSREPDPVYNGKRLSDWVKVYEQDLLTTTMSVETKEAVRHLGTNVVPMLLRELRAKDSPLKDKLVALAQRQHWFKIQHISARAHRGAAQRGFEALGAEGKSAVPGLIEMYKQNRADPEMRICILCSLTFIGPEAKPSIPTLLQELGDTNDRVIVYIIMVLAKIHSEPQWVVPALISKLEHPSPDVRGWAAGTLGLFGSDARSAIPALSKSQDDSDSGVKHLAREALTKIDPEAAAKAGIK